MTYHASKMFTPYTIGGVTVKNRIVFPSMCTYFCEENGTIGKDILAYVRERARSGVGLIVMPGSPHGKPSAGRPAISGDQFEAGWRDMAAIVHEYGCRLFCQLHPAAMQAGRGDEHTPPEEYDLDILRELVTSYAVGARRCKDWGLDGVEIHGGHAHEIAQFMSPLYNQRTDEYGVDDTGRSRLPVEIVRAIKARCGTDFPVIFRISGDEMVEGGRNLEGTIRIAQLLEQAGVDAINVSVGMTASSQYISGPMDLPDCFNVAAAESVRKNIGIPVIAVNRIAHPEEAERIIAEGRAEFVAMGRALLADPELIHKYLGENPLPICACVGCNQGCKGHVSQKRIRCVQNPRLGRERTLRFPQASEDLKKRKIVIVGAGPAGLEAACRLVQSGVRPIIFEKAASVGGLIRFAQMPPRKANMSRIITYREEVLRQYGVEIRFDTEADEDTIRGEKPDLVIVATGSTPILPRFAQGTNGGNILTGDDVFSGRAEQVGHKIAVLGGGLVGCETAEYLASRGRDVTLFELRDEIATELVKSRRYFLIKAMRELGIKVHVQCEIEKLRLPNLLLVERGARRVVGGYDAAIVAVGRRPTFNLAEHLRSICPRSEVVEIGDAKRPGMVLDAISDAAECISRFLCG